MKKGTCSNCKVDNSNIINHTKMLCIDCNEKRLHSNGNKKYICNVEIKKEFNLWSEILSKLKVKRPRIKQISTKQEFIKIKIKEAYQKVDENWGGKCDGCKQMIQCDHSHLIPLSYSKEFAADVRNIKHHCRECHLKWESHDLKQMVQLCDFTSNMQFIKNNCIIYYNLLIHKR